MDARAVAGRLHSTLNIQHSTFNIAFDVHLLALIILIAWVMALIRTIVNLTLIPGLRAGMRAAQEPLVSLIIPARDEAHIIERTVRAFLAQTYRESRGDRRQRPLGRRNRRHRPRHSTTIG